MEHKHTHPIRLSFIQPKSGLKSRSTKAGSVRNPHPLWIQFHSFSYRFQQNFCQIRGFCPFGKPGSAPEQNRLHQRPHAYNKSIATHIGDYIWNYIRNHTDMTNIGQHIMQNALGTTSETTHLQGRYGITIVSIGMIMGVVR